MELQADCGGGREGGRVDGRGAGEEPREQTEGESASGPELHNEAHLPCINPSLPVTGSWRCTLWLKEEFEELRVLARAV